MDNETYQHYLDELITSAENNDSVKLIAQLNYFNDLSLSQQLEAGALAEEKISAGSYFKIYTEIIKKDPHHIRANVVLRKLLKTVFCKNQKLLVEFLKIVDISSQKTILFIDECVLECRNQDITIIWSSRKKGDKIPDQIDQINAAPQTISRESTLSRIKELGNQNSIDSIKELANLAGTDVGFDVIIINQLMDSKLDEGIDETIEFLASTSTRVRHYAIAKLEELRAKVAPSLINKLKQTFAFNSSDHSIAILGVLKSVASKDSSRDLRRLMNSVPEDVNVRVAYYETLYKLSPTTVAPFLVEQVCDGVDDVAYSAASLLDRQCSQAIVDGIQNVIISELITTQRLVEVLIFASCSNLINSLSEEQTIKDEVKRQCQLPGMEDYAKLYNITESSSKSEKSSSIWAIDDSRMILRMYDHFAVQSSSSVKTFEQGKELLSTLNSEQPALFFIDLNMPGMSGVEVAQAINNMGYNKIPKILVTTQSDAALDENAKELFSEIVKKPFDSGILETAANRYLTKG